MIKTALLCAAILLCAQRAGASIVAGFGDGPNNDGFEDFARTMEVKLVRELGVRVIGQLATDTDHDG